LFFVIDVDPEEFHHFYDELETQKTYDSVISLVKNQGEKDEETGNEKNYKEPGNLIKDYKTAICYLELLRKFSQTVSNTEFLDFTLISNVCVERDAFEIKIKN
jgi:hypothetical protein